MLVRCNAAHRQLNSVGGSLAYTPFIDGLRAIAIIGVVAFHVDRQVFAGGYLGVDVFFVISGFLILGTTLQALDSGRFSVADFLARRALRIFPTLALVLLSVLFLAWLFPLTPMELADLRHSTQAASLFLANYYFWDKVGYFNPISDAKPLLHTWSLSVEEQFYILVATASAALTIFSKRYPSFPVKRAVFYFGASLFVISACLAASTVGFSEESRFYLVPFRMWEFLLGGGAFAVLYVGLVPEHRAAQIGTVCAIGGSFLVAALLIFDLPGALPAAVVSIAAVLIGCFLAPGNLVARLLSSAPMTFIGKTSYAWYLWHWPILFFARTLMPDDDGRHDIAAVAISFIAAMLTYFLLERRLVPFRRIERTASQSRGMVLLCLSLLMAPLLASFTEAPIPETLAREHRQNSQHAHKGFDSIMRDGQKIFKFGPEDLRVIVLGDSQARHLVPLAADISKKHTLGIEVWASGGCPPFSGNYDVHPDERYNRRCKRFTHVVQGWLRERQHKVDTVVLAARWMSYERRMEPSLARSELRASIVRLASLGYKVVVVGVIPEFPLRPADCIYRASMLNLSPEKECHVAIHQFDKVRSGIFDLVTDLQKTVSNLILVDPIGTFCSKETCSPVVHGESAYADPVHLSARGAIELLSILEPAVAH